MDSKLQSPKQNCAHCGVECSSPIHHEANSFCCQGCLQVYQFIKSHELLSYYELDQNPAKKVEALDLDDYQILDHQDFAKAFITYQDEKTVQCRWSIPSIHCRACVWLLEKLPEIEPGVYRSQVDLMRKHIDLSFNPEVLNLKELAQTLNSIGYGPDLKVKKNDNSQSHSKEEWLQIGVAGFCFGNVMLFSFPEYLGGEELGENFENLFRFLNLALSLPVLLYCSKNILMSGFKATQYKSFGVDTPISLGIITLFIYSLYEVLAGTGSGYFDSLCGLVFFLLIGRSFQRKNFENLVFERDEHRFFPLTILAKHDESFKNIPLQELQTGQEYLVKNHAMIPTDSELLQGEAALDYRLVTGETDLKVPDQGEIIYAGGLQQKGEIRLKALKPVNDSSLAKLWENINELQPPVFENLLDRIGRIFTIVIVSLAILTFFLWKETSIGKGIELACAVLIIACPCALALSAPLSLGASIRQLAKYGCYIKSANLVEILSKINVLIFDKTGTLSKIDQSLGSFEGKAPETMYEYARALANQSDHPVSKAIVQTGEVPKLYVEEFESITNCGIQGVIDGHTVKLGKGSWAAPESSELEHQTILVVDHEVVDTFSKHVVWRQEILDNLPSLSKSHQLYLLSGDHNRDSDFLSTYFPLECMKFNQSPKDKAEFVNSLQSSKNRVAMIGDGINDSLALRSSDAGITIPLGSGQFTPSSDVIITEENFKHLSKYLTYARKSLQVISIGVITSLLYNVVGISAAMSGWVSPLFSAILMPISSLTVVTLSIGLTSRYARQIFSKEGA